MLLFGGFLAWSSVDLYAAVRRDRAAGTRYQGGTMSGTVIAAILLAVVSTFLAEFSDVRMIIYSLVLVLIMIFRPGGLMGSKEVTETVLGRVFKGRRSEQTKEAL